jgi:hypothetical protein
VKGPIVLKRHRNRSNVYYRTSKFSVDKKSSIFARFSIGPKLLQPIKKRIFSILSLIMLSFCCTAIAGRKSSSLSAIKSHRRRFTESSNDRKHPLFSTPPPVDDEDPGASLLTLLRQAKKNSDARRAREKFANPAEDAKKIMELLEESIKTVSAPHTTSQSSSEVAQNPSAASRGPGSKRPSRLDVIIDIVSSARNSSNRDPQNQK